MKHTTQQVAATLAAIRHRVDVNTLAEIPAERLAMNEIGRVAFESVRPLFVDAYEADRGTGSLIVIDPLSNATVAAGMIQEPRRGPAADRAAREALHELQFRVSRVTPAERFARASHYPATIWLTARLELAYLLERQLFELGCLVRVIAEEAESRILPEVAGLLSAVGLITIISASEEDAGERERARAQVGAGRFFEFGPEALATSDERAAAQIRSALEDRGVLPSSRFSDQDGI